MIDYLLRSILCSGLFIAVYFLLFQNEKMLRFNRFYLLVSAFLSLLLPLIKFSKRDAMYEQLGTFIAQNTEKVEERVGEMLVQPTLYFSSETVLLLIYCIVVLFLLTRFLLFHYRFIREVKEGSTSKLQGATLVFTNKKYPVHSYLHYIFIPKDEFEQDLTDNAIIDHELAHVSQKHTLDILFIEFLLVLAWFNPFFYLYRNSIQLNHEFLADTDVLDKQTDSCLYKNLIIDKVAQANGLVNTPFSCPFNYIKTKKRIKMMNKMRIPLKNVLKQMVVVPTLFTAILLFSENSLAREAKQVIKNVVEQTVPVPDNSDEELQNQFDMLLKPYIKEKNGRTTYYGIKEADQKILVALFLKMSKEQQEKQRVRFMPPFKQHVPSETEFEEWKDPKLYGVWLNGKRISNAELSNFKNTDISHYFKSRLLKNAKNYGKHVYHLDVMTNDYFKAYNKDLEDNPYLVFKPRAVKK